MGQISSLFVIIQSHPVKCIVSRSKYSEGSGRGEGINQAGCLDCGQQGRKPENRKSGKLSRLEQFNFGGFLTVQFDYGILFVHKF